MFSAKTVAWVVLIVAASSAAVRADNISTSGNFWVFFGTQATTQHPPSTSDSPSAPWPGTTGASPTWGASVTTTPLAVTTGTSAPVVYQTAAPSQQTSTTPVSAFLNFGTAPYPEQSQLTVGSASPWYTSPSVTKFFGGSAPDAGQQAAFESQVLQDVQHTFSISGMNPTLTTNPNVPALHTLSVVSGISYGPNPNAIGITDVGGSGFGFIDKLSYATSLTDLAWAVAHNLSHEMMHAFGIGYHPDQTGQYIDAADATWSVLTSPDTKFSPLATQVITATGYGVNTGTGSAAPGQQNIDGDQQILAAPVPEPATIALWSFTTAGLVLYGRYRSRRNRVA